MTFDRAEQMRAAQAVRIAKQKAEFDERCSEENICRALRDCKGQIVSAARVLQVSPRAMKKRWTPKCQEVVEELLEYRLDRAENKLDDAIERGEAWAVCFFLKTRGKNRGYIERGLVISHTLDADRRKAELESLLENGHADRPAEANSADNGSG